MKYVRVSFILQSVFLSLIMNPLSVLSASNTMPFEDPSIIVVYSASDKDAQLITSGGSELGIDQLSIKGPDNLVKFGSDFVNKSNVGQADFQFDTLEPTLEKLKQAYPAGAYTFSGKTVSDDALESVVTLSYDLPETPKITNPMDGETNVATENLMLTWEVIGAAQAIRLEMENEESEIAFKVDLPPTVTSFQVPNGWLEENAEYVMDIKVIGDNGNVTVTDIRFTTNRP